MSKKFGCLEIDEMREYVNCLRYNLNYDDPGFVHKTVYAYVFARKVKYRTKEKKLHLIDKHFNKQRLTELLEAIEKAKLPVEKDLKEVFEDVGKLRHDIEQGIDHWIEAKMYLNVDGKELPVFDNNQ